MGVIMRNLGSAIWETVRSSIDDLGNRVVEITGLDLEAFVDAVEAAGMDKMEAMDLMKTGEGMVRVLRALMSAGNEKVVELASSILESLGWELE
jgi:hypothetical protein